MAMTLDPATKVYTIYQADLTNVSGTLYSADTDQLRKEMMTLLASEDYIWMDDSYIHNTEVTVAGTTFARTISTINGYSITFSPDAQWTARLEGSNNDWFDVENGILNQNQVQVIPTNSAGLITNPKIDEVHTRLGLEAGNPITDVTGGITDASGDIDIDRTGDGVTSSTLTRQ